MEFSAQGLRQEFEQAGVVAGIIMSMPSRDPNQPSGSPEELILADGTVEGLLSCVGVNPERFKEDHKELDYIEGELEKG